jgi:transposase
VLDEDGEIDREVQSNPRILTDSSKSTLEANLRLKQQGTTTTSTILREIDVAVANPAGMKLIADSDRKTDRIDANQLARLVRLGSVPESYVPFGRDQKMGS